MGDLGNHGDALHRFGFLADSPASWLFRVQGKTSRRWPVCTSREYVRKITSRETWNKTFSVEKAPPPFGVDERFKVEKEGKAARKAKTIAPVS